ncbi:DUF6503 family protein [Maribacter sp. 2307ULW6-5]|uniref:DUF6503 family protein n=1 Tax=Maribacter sp. 2307ULW6-5 TaxID=3386275 RepID=UPI0039BC3040
MRLPLLFLCVGLCLSCKERQPSSSSPAQDLVDKSIVAAGGERHRNSDIGFYFRDIHYSATWENGKRILKRKMEKDTATIVDVMYPDSLARFVNGQFVPVPDTTALKYANSINSVHYFAYLPYGLNDAAVNKAYLGREELKGVNYHKVQVTFDEEGGGTDHDDVYLYWFHPNTHLPDYLAYEFHVDGGGQRFREAYNPRWVEGIRFVDYRNYRPKGNTGPIQDIGVKYEKGELELLSKIELKQVQVSAGSYN